MSKNLSRLELEALQLPPKERARLIRRLIATLDGGEDAGAEQQWLDEAERRLAAWRCGEVATYPGDEVFEALLR